MAPRKSSSKATETKPEPMPAAAAPAAPEPAQDAIPAGRKPAAKPRARKAAEPEAAAQTPPPETAKPAKAARAAKTPAKARAAKAVTPEPEAEPALPELPATTAREVTSTFIPSAAAVLTDQARTILQAIQEGRAVELLFADPDTNPPRTFEPRQLIFDVFAQGWYIWGWDRRYNAERHHLLSLVAQVNPVEGMGRAAQGPYKDGTPANLIGGWLGGDPIHVKAVLLKQWIFAVRQAPAPFPEFAIEDLEEGKAQVSFTATDLRAITRWVMQFGDGIQIQEPQRLLDRIKQVGLAWAGKPAQPAPAPAPAPKPQAASPKPQSSRSGSHRQSERQSERPERAERPERQSERQSERQTERQAERQSEHRFEPVPERKSHEGSKPAKPAKIEIRIDRL